MIFGKRSLGKRARAAEAAGDLREAALLWAEAGDRGKVAACWVGIADRALSDEDRVSALRTAIEHLDLPAAAAARKAAEIKLASILLRRAEVHGAAGARERELLDEAARTLERCGETLSAGKAFEMLGRPDDAARAYQAGGHVEALERVLTDDALQASQSRRLSSRYDEYRLGLASGARDRALSAIRECATLGDSASSYADLLRDLEARLPPIGRVGFVMDGVSREFVGGGRVVLGRGEADVPLRNLDVSRRHVEIRKEGQGWTVEDLRSRSSTKLGGLPIGAPMPLPESGRIGIGPSVAIAFEAAPDRLDLEIVEGLDRGRKVTVLSAPLALPGTGRSLDFVLGRATLVGNSQVLLNGARTADPVVLVAGDVVEVAGRRIEVAR